MEQIKLYIKESYNELTTKVTWPTWGKLLQDTRLVLIASMILGLLIFFMDVIAQFILDFIYPNDPNNG